MFFQTGKTWTGLRGKVHNAKCKHTQTHRFNIKIACSFTFYFHILGAITLRCTLRMGIRWQSTLWSPSRPGDVDPTHYSRAEYSYHALHTLPNIQQVTPTLRLFSARSPSPTFSFRGLRTRRRKRGHWTSTVRGHDRDRRRTPQSQCGDPGRLNTTHNVRDISSLC